MKKKLEEEKLKKRSLFDESNSHIETILKDNNIAEV